MCGIGGMVLAPGASAPPDLASKLLVALAHRGPDGEGRHTAPGVVMVQARLAIIDLQTGDQPFYEPGGAALVANGEIYNYRELAAAIAPAPLRTKSDCELPLWLYRRHGLDFANLLRGMYAIAIHDPAEDRVILSRDPFGIKQLYYAETPRGLIFASEPQAILATGLVTPKVRPDRAEELLELQFTTGRTTIFEGIERLLPGETVAVSGGRIVERRRIAALPDPGTDKQSDAAALDALDRELMETVSFHQRSDVPYGMFLSGGIDSSALLYAMSRLNDAPVRAYTAGFPGTSVADERDLARLLAAKLGAEHVEVTVTAEDFWTSLPAIAAAVDDPTADYAIIPTFKLAAEAAKDLKVVLSGEGGDELLGGYGRYRAVMRPWWLGGRAIRAKGALHGLGILRANDPSWRDGIRASELRASALGGTRLQVAQAVDCADWLPNDLLIKLDRCLMSHGLEGRTPFLDRPFAKLAYRLEDHQKIRGGRGKHLLRAWLAQRLPEAEPFSAKRGFTVPVGDWIAARSEKLGPLVAAQAGIQEMARPDAVRDLFSAAGRTGAKRKGKAAWQLLFYALWHRRHIEGVRDQGDVFDTLAAR